MKQRGAGLNQSCSQQEGLGEWVGRLPLEWQPAVLFVINSKRVLGYPSLTFVLSDMRWKFLKLMCCLSPQ